MNFGKEKIEILNYENLNDELMRCKIRVLYAGENDNGYNIDKEVIEKALDTIYYIPIVGEVVEYENGISFGDHAMTEEEDGSIVCNTIPFGVVAGKADNEIEWVKVDGKEYLTCVGYLWRRYDLVDKFENQDFYQSMEIALNKSRKRRGKKIIDVLDFSFSALCILNKDLDNWENSVAPCFDGANIEKFQKNNKFDAELNELIKKIETFSATKGEDAHMAKNEENLNKDTEDFAKDEEKVKCEATEDETKENADVETDETEDTEDEKENEDDSKDEEKEDESEDETEDETFAKKENEDKASFALSLDEKLKQIRQELAKKTIEVEYCWGEKYIENEFYFETLFETEELGDVVVVNTNNFAEKYFIPYTFNGDAVSLDFENKVKCVVTYRAFEGENNLEVFAEKLEAMTANFEKHTNNLQTSIKELKEFRRQVEFAKRQEEVENTIAKFSFQEDEIATFKKQAIDGEMEIETLELHLFALAGKKAMATFSKDEQKTETVKFSKNNNKIKMNPYGDLIR